jgi:predicted alpha/beta hydrolase
MKITIKRFYAVIHRQPAFYFRQLVNINKRAHYWSLITPISKILTSDDNYLYHHSGTRY